MNLGPYDSVNPMVLEVSMVDRTSYGTSDKPPNKGFRLLGFWRNAIHISAAEKYSLRTNKLLACYWAFRGTKYPTKNIRRL